MILELYLRMSSKQQKYVVTGHAGNPKPFEMFYSKFSMTFSCKLQCLMQNSELVNFLYLEKLVVKNREFWTTHHKHLLCDQKHFFCIPHTSQVNSS